MAKFVICKACNKFIEYKPVVEHKGGMTYTRYKCPECGHISTTTTNHIHYGEDGKNK